MACTCPGVRGAAGMDARGGPAVGGRAGESPSGGVSVCSAREWARVCDGGRGPVGGEIRRDRLQRRECQGSAGGPGSRPVLSSGTFWDEGSVLYL